MKLSVQEKIGFGLGDTASNFIWATISSFLMFYYTDIFGIAAASVGTLFLFARVFDGFTDFVMGAIADRTESRWGKFRPYLLWMCLPLALTFVLTFTTPDISTSGKVIYAWITYNLLMIFYTAINIPYSALSGVMTDHPQDRMSLNAYRMVLAQVGGFIVNGATLPLITYFGKGNAAHGYQTVVIVFAIVMTVLFLVTFATTRERIRPPVEQKTKLKDDLKILLRNPHWIVLFAAATANMIFIAIRGAGSMYYFKYHMNMTDAEVSMFLVAGSVAFIIGALLTGLVAGALGKKKAFAVSMAGTGISAVPFFWLSSGDTAQLYAAQLVGGVSAGINATLFWSMIADAADFSEWKFNVRTTGIVFSATTCAQKVGLGIGGAAAGYLMDFYKYKPNVVQTPEALHGIILLMSAIPAVGFIAISLFFMLYGLNENVCDTMRQELNARREQKTVRETPPIQGSTEALASGN